MTQNPYAQIGSPGYPEMPEPVSRRTSMLAVFSLILALICFVPGAGALAVILGGAAIFFISTSRGRLGGMGLAITGVVLGLLFSLVWITLVVGAGQVMSTFRGQLIGPAESAMLALNKGDLKSGRAMFTREADTAITDAMLTDFTKRVKDSMGEYQGSPQNILEFISAYGAAGQQMRHVQGRNDMIPFPGNFDKGAAIIVMQLDQSSMHGQGGPPTGPGGTFQFPVINIGVLPPAGTPIWLLDPAKAEYLVSPGSGGAAPGDGTPGDDHKKDDKPGDGGDADSGGGGKKPGF